MNTVFALIAIVGGGFGSLVAWRVVALDKLISYSDAEAWHDRYGNIFKYAGPVAVIIGLLLLLF